MLRTHLFDKPTFPAFAVIASDQVCTDGRDFACADAKNPCPIQGRNHCPAICRSLGDGAIQAESCACWLPPVNAPDPSRGERLLAKVYRSNQTAQNISKSAPNFRRDLQPFWRKKPRPYNLHLCLPLRDRVVVRQYGLGAISPCST
jgi:hypothetical protein